MAEYYDFPTNIQHMVRTIEKEGYSFWGSMDQKTQVIKSRPHDLLTWCQSMRNGSHGTLDPRFLEVRKGICITGYNRDALLVVKDMIFSLIANHPIPLETFHVRRISDIGDGALLVPKIVLVATHCPGKKLIDEDGNQGQLDLLYDEACDLGADICVIYMGLPGSIYPPFRQMIYHPKLAETLFPTQPILKDLAKNGALLTVVGESDFTTMQKNALREWILKPVSKNHPIFKTADFLSSAEFSFSERDFFSEPESFTRRDNTFVIEEERAATAAEENHPLADAYMERKKKKSRRKKLFSGLRRFRVGGSQQQAPNISVEEDDDVELELYNAGRKAGYTNHDALSNFSV